MKKNKFMRIACALLVLTLLSTCVISGTFAKYLTKEGVSDTARVAKWGVIINANGTLYSDAYLATGGLPTGWAASAADDSISVVTPADNGDNLVAPGTQSLTTGMNIGITGAPEVDVTVKAVITAEDIYLAAGDYAVMVPVSINDQSAFETMAHHDESATTPIISKLYAKDTTAKTYTHQKVTPNDATDTDSVYSSTATYYVATDIVNAAAAYNPVKYTVTKDTAIADGTTAAAAADAIVKKVNSTATVTDADATVYGVSYEVTSATIAANTELGDTYGAMKITWAWAIGENTEANEDTILGQLMAYEQGTDTYYIVYCADIDGASAQYEDITVDATNKIATIGDGTTTTVANLETNFNIQYTVTQID